LNSTAGNESLTEDGVNAENGGASVDDEAEKRQVAEATIIPEDAEQSSSAGVSQEGDNDGQEEHAGLSQADGDDPETLETTGADKKNGLPKKGFAKKIQYAAGGIGVGILILAVLYMAGLIKGRSDIDDQGIVPVHTYLGSTDGGAHDVLYFDRFLVLLEGDDALAYLLLSLSVVPSSKAVYKEIAVKRTICRDVIYEVLKKSVSTREKLVDAESRLPQEIMDALDQVLESGTVEKVHVSEFLVV